jgi:hypothetical protein
VSIGFVSRRMALLSILVLGSSGLLFGAAKSGMLGKKELKSLIAGAKTAEQHRRIAGHYRAQAKALCEEAVEHEEMAAGLAFGQSACWLRCNLARHVLRCLGKLLEGI